MQYTRHYSVTVFQLFHALAIDVTPAYNHLNIATNKHRQSCHTKLCIWFIVFMSLGFLKLKKNYFHIQPESTVPSNGSEIFLSMVRTESLYTMQFNTEKKTS